MRWLVMLAVVAVAACTDSNTAPTGQPGLATSGAGPQTGATAGTSTGGGPLGAGTADNPAGAK